MAGSRGSVVADDEIKLLAAPQRLADENTTVVTSVRLPAALRDAVNAAVGVGVDATVNDAWVTALRERLETVAQRLAFDLHYTRFPDARRSLAEVTRVIDAMVTRRRYRGTPRRQPTRATRARPAASSHSRTSQTCCVEPPRKSVTVKPDADADDVLLYAAALRSA